MNYGAVLQAFALQQAIQKKLHYENDIIDYRSDKQKEMYSIFKKDTSVRSVVKNAAAAVYYPLLKKKKEVFDEFVNHRLKLTYTCSETEDVLRVVQKYDAAVCGSDQIWNTELRDASEAYYLPGFKKKISYAASLGKKISDRSLEVLDQYIDEYQALSFREKASIDTVKAKLGKDSELVIDPVFLLTKEEWTETAGLNQTDKSTEKYIFLYSINYPDSFLKIVSALAKRMQLPVVTAYGAHNITKGVKTQLKGIRVDYCADPVKFLDYIQNASLVVTDSFHGTAFSIIFHKEFMTYQSVKGDSSIRDERIANLLETAGIEGNSLNDNHQPFENRMNQTDWDQVDERISVVREKSLNWLKESIEKAAGISRGEGKNIPVLYEKKEDCCGCGACSVICPVQAISMIEDEERFLYPKIDVEKCIGCHKCLSVCAFKADKEVVNS